MRNHTTRLLLTFVALTAACGQDDPVAEPHEEAQLGPDAGSEEPKQLTYYQDVLPVFEQHCLQCHREGGIAPFRMDEYGAVKPLAGIIAHATRERTMPPWGVTSDGSCGEFADSAALSDAEIALITQWAEEGAAEGVTKEVNVPELPGLTEAAEFRTPEFVPVAVGGRLAESDEYRCFAVDKPEDATGYITGYEVLPGTAEIVHHVGLFLVDPAAPARNRNNSEGARTNGELMAALHAKEPDRDGWPCFSGAGEGVLMDASPVVWAPGQGVVSFPKGTGVPLEKRHQVVVQIHYNLADVTQRGKSDSTLVRLRTSQDVDEVALFALEDPLINSLFEDEVITLPPGQESTLYSWSRSAQQIGLGSMTKATEAKLYGVMPHMHALGRRYDMTITQPGSAAECAAKVDHWDFHWQRLYFYAEPYTLTGDTKISVTCDFDTSGVTQPVQPGWGTSNEMCLATLFITVPKDSWQAIAF